MGKSNNPAKRAAQEAELRAKKSRSGGVSGFVKLVLVLVLALAIIGPFFAGLASTVPSAPGPAKPVTTPSPVVSSTVVPAPATAPAPGVASPAPVVGQ